MKKFIAKKPEKEVISLRIPSEILKIIDKKALNEKIRHIKESQILGIEIL